MARKDNKPLSVDSDTDSEEELLIANIKARMRSTGPPYRSSSSSISRSSQTSSEQPVPKRSRLAPSGRTDFGSSSKTAAKTVAARKLSAAEAATARPAKAESKKAAAAERIAARLAKAEAKKAADAKRIADRFAAHKRGGGSYRDEVEVVVSPTLFHNRTKKDILREVRQFYGAQLVSQDHAISNMLFWRVRFPKGKSEEKTEWNDAGSSVFVFPPEQFIAHIENNTLFSLAEFSRSRRPSTKIIFVTWGLHNECKRRANAVFQGRAHHPILDTRDAQESSTALYMDYDVRVHEFTTEQEVAQHLLDLTETLAKAPFYNEPDHLEASLQYRDSKRKISGRTTVLATRPAPDSQRDGEEDEEHSSAFDSEQKIPRDPVTGLEGNCGALFARTEGSGELGHMYLAILAQVPRISLTKAKAIRDRYPTLHRLLEAYMNCSCQTERDKLLAEVRYGSNNRRIGQFDSKLLALVFTMTDPSAAVRE